jgi:hypothetical protein
MVNQTSMEGNYVTSNRFDLMLTKKNIEGGRRPLALQKKQELHLPEARSCQQLIPLKLHSQIQRAIVIVNSTNRIILIAHMNTTRIDSCACTAEQSREPSLTVYQHQQTPKGWQ